MSNKRLRSVAHSIAHHGVSGVCYVHPNLGAFCLDKGIRSIRINLLKPGFEPAVGDVPRKVNLAIEAFCEKFLDIMALENIKPAEVEEAYASFEFLRSRWPIGCYVAVRSAEGDIIESAVDQVGNPAEVIFVK